MITVGLSRPVNSFSFDTFSAVWMIGPSASWASLPYVEGSSLYCSTYILRAEAIDKPTVKRCLGSLFVCGAQQRKAYTAAAYNL